MNHSNTDTLSNTSNSTVSGIFDLKYLTPRILKRWYWLALGLILGVLYAFLKLELSTPLYSAQSTILVKNYNLDSMGRFDPAELDLRSQEAVETIRVGLERAELFTAVASDRSIRELEGIMPPPQRTVSSLFGAETSLVGGAEVPTAGTLSNLIRSWTNTSIRPETRFIDINVSHSNPKVAAALANRIVHHYVKLSEKSKTSGAKSTLEFLLAEADRVEGELHNAKRLLNSYKTPIDAETSLLETEQEIIELKTRYRSKYPKLIAAETKKGIQISRLKNQLASAIENPIDIEYWQPYHQLTSKLEEASVFATLRSALVARADLLKSGIESKQTLYESLLERIETKEVSATQSESEFIPYNSAVIPGSPYSPNTKTVLLTSAFNGFLFGVGVAFLFQLIDNKFHSIHELEEASGLSVLSAIRRLPTKGRLKALLPDVIPSSFKDVSDEVALVAFGKTSVHAEMFRVLRASVQLLGNTQKRKITVITSSTPSEGKTYISTSLALTFAKQGTRTLLVDFDLRKPSVHKLFNVERDNGPGIVHLLNGTKRMDDVVQTFSDMPNLSVIFSGPKAVNPGELLEPTYLEALIEQLSSEYDHIIFDTAPLLAVPDTRIIAQFAQNLALVVRGKSTTKKAVNYALASLADDNINPSGIILNDYIEPNKKGSGYGYGGYGYGKYSGYGNYGDDES